MAFTTKLQLIDEKFTQLTGTTLTLDGLNIFTGAVDLTTASASTTGDNFFIDGAAFSTFTASTTTANNGLTKIGDNIVLGGTLTGNTTIDGDSNALALTDISTLTLSASTITVGSNSGGFGGAKYDADYSANYTLRSIPDIDYVTGNTGVQSANNGLTKSGTNVYLGGTLTGATNVDGASGTYNMCFSEMGSILLNAGSSNDVQVSLDGTMAELNISSTSGSFAGARYGADYSANYQDRSLIDKGYLALVTGTTLSTADNGLTATSGNVQLGGELTEDTVIGGDSGTYCLTLGSVGSNLDQLNSYGGGSATFDYPTININGDSANKTIVLDSSGIIVTLNNNDFRYAADYSANYTSRSLTDKAYVDSIAAGLDPKESVRVATVTAITGTYVPAGGTAGSGQFTGVSTTVVDDITLADTNRILVKNQADAKQNGIYERISATVWNRASDQDGSPANEVSAGNYTFVETGTTLTATGWVLAGDGVLTLNTDDIDWIQFNASAGFIAGDGIDIVGNTISVELDTNSGLDFNGGALRVAPTIAGNGIDLTSGVLSVDANNGLTAVGPNVKLGGALTGITTIDTNNVGFAMGKNVISTGDTTFAFGYNVCVGGFGSVALGYNTCATQSGSFAAGYGAQAIGSRTIALGYNTCANANNATAMGSNTCANENNATAMGSLTLANGESSFAQNEQTHSAGRASHAGGRSCNTSLRVLASGATSFNHSRNDASQTTGHGALAPDSVILGGLNHNIAIGNTKAAVIGGNTIKLTGTTYIDTTAVANLAVMSTPSAGITGDSVLVRRGTTGKVFQVTQASIASAATAAITANNGLTKTGSNIRLGGTLTGNTTIDISSFGLAIGYNNIATGDSSFAGGGRNARACGVYSFAGGYNTRAAGSNSFAHGYLACACGQTSFASQNGRALGNYSTAMGAGSYACGDCSFASGGGTLAIAEASHAQGFITRACGVGSFSSGFGDNTHFILASGQTSFNHSRNTTGQTTGHGALASDSVILGGLNHNIAVGNTRAAIIGGSTIKLTGTTYVDTTAVGNLAIMSTPSTGVSGDTILVRRGTTGKIFQVSQSSITSTIELNKLPITILNTSATLTGSDHVVLVNTSGATTVTLPASPVDGQVYHVKDKSGNALTNTISISGNGNNIDGASTASINTDYGSLYVAYSSVEDEWFTLAFIN